MQTRFAGIGGHHSQKSGTVEWLTPPSIIAALGPFDLDPCAPIVQPYPTADFRFTVRDNGLLQAWTWDNLARFGECSCRTNIPTYTSTTALSDQTSLKITKQECPPVIGAASGAEKLSLQTSNTSAKRMPENIGVAGAGPAQESTPKNQSLSNEWKTQKPSQQQNSAMPYQRKGALEKECGRSPTITDADSDTQASLFSGHAQIGAERLSSSVACAPTAIKARRSRKTTLSRSAIRNFQERFEEISSLPASPAIHLSATEAHSNGSPMPLDSSGYCPSCRAKLLVEKSGARPRVFLNPPYSNNVIEKWLARLAEHDRGTALIFARTETAAFSRYVWDRATAILFMEGRINFHVGEAFTDEKTGRRYEVGDRAPGNAGAPTVLCAYGMDDADVLAGCEIAGRFVPLRIPRSVIVRAFQDLIKNPERNATWREVIAEFAAGQDGPFELDDLYRFVRAHPKAAGNRHPEAKARQQLQRGGYKRVDRGLWEIGDGR